MGVNTQLEGNIEHPRHRFEIGTHVALLYKIELLLAFDGFHAYQVMALEKLVYQKLLIGDPI